MLNLYSMILVGHVALSAAMIVLVLLQRGKGADAGAAFGSGASGTVFGAKGSANFLSRSTAALATMFFITSLSLAYLGSRSVAPDSLMDSVSTPIEDVSSVLPVIDDMSETAGELPVLPDLDAPPTNEVPQTGGETEEEVSP